MDRKIDLTEDSVFGNKLAGLTRIKRLIKVDNSSEMKSSDIFVETKFYRELGSHCDRCGVEFDVFNKGEYDLCKRCEKELEEH